ncbi:MAG: hypothetical protein LBV78_15295 [Kitasatospora sp.]|jgi:putative NADH-flavin reductase|nr:hypothetical protein [Kitasatospora sp.]
MDLTPDAPATGRYTSAVGTGTGRISYADLAVALLKEIESPRHHAVQLAVSH